MLKLIRMVQKLKNDKNRDDSLLFSWAQLCGIRGLSQQMHVDIHWLDVPERVKYKLESRDDGVGLYR